MNLFARERLLAHRAAGLEHTNEFRFVWFDRNHFGLGTRFARSMTFVRQLAF